MTNAWIEEGSTEADIDIRLTPKNISLALPTLTSFISGKDIEDKFGSEMIESMTSRSNTTEQAKSMALRLLIHFMGDVHQPLHAANMYSKEFPEGDKGGNSIKLKYRYGANNLHSVWDKVLY